VPKIPFTSPVFHCPLPRPTGFAMFVRRCNTILKGQDLLGNNPTPLVAPLSSQSAGLVIELSVDSSVSIDAVQSATADEKLSPPCRVTDRSTASILILRGPNTTKSYCGQTWPTEENANCCSQDTRTRQNETQNIEHRKEENEVTKTLSTENFKLAGTRQAGFPLSDGLSKIDHLESPSQLRWMPLKYTLGGGARQRTTHQEDDMALDTGFGKSASLNAVNGYVGKCNVGLTSNRSFLFGYCSYGVLIG
jgi:hypothetical protein